MSSAVNLSLAEARTIAKYGLTSTLLQRIFTKGTDRWGVCVTQRQTRVPRKLAIDVVEVGELYGEFDCEVAPLVEAAWQHGVRVAEAYSNGDGESHILFDGDEGSRWFIEVLNGILVADDDGVSAYAACTLNDDGDLVGGIGFTFPAHYIHRLSECLSVGEYRPARFAPDATPAAGHRRGKREQPRPR